MTSYNVTASGEGTLTLSGIQTPTQAQGVTSILQPRTILKHQITKVERLSAAIDKGQFQTGEINHQSVIAYVLKITLAPNIVPHDYTVGFPHKWKVILEGFANLPPNILAKLNTTHRLVGVGSNFILVAPNTDSTEGTGFYVDLIPYSAQLQSNPVLANAKSVDVFTLNIFNDQKILPLIYVGPVTGQPETYRYSFTANGFGQDYTWTGSEVIYSKSNIGLLSDAGRYIDSLAKDEDVNDLHPAMWVVPTNALIVAQQNVNIDYGTMLDGQTGSVNLHVSSQFSILIALPTQSQSTQSQAILDCQDKLYLALCKCVLGWKPKYTPEEGVTVINPCSIFSHAVSVQNRAVYIHEYQFRIVERLSNEASVFSEDTYPLWEDGMDRAFRQLDESFTFLDNAVSELSLHLPKPEGHS